MEISVGIITCSGLKNLPALIKSITSQKLSEVKIKEILVVTIKTHYRAVREATLSAPCIIPLKIICQKARKGQVPLLHNW